MSDINWAGDRRAPRNYDIGRGDVPVQTGPFVGTVMDTYDPTYTGRIRVWIHTFGDENNKDDESTWFTMRYLSPFYGITPHKTIDAPDPDFEQNGHAYGMWATVPDVGVQVLCIFAEGDPNQGYYIGFIPEPQMNHMIPAIGAQTNPHFNNDAQEEKLAHASRIPVVEVDKKEATMKDASFRNKERPIHSVVASQMWKQGIIADNIRGPISSSAQRESPSYVIGINTPGRPIWVEGMFDNDVEEKLKAGEVSDTGIVGRRGGHSFVMDDGDLSGNDNLVRIRTSQGHQITMSDDGNSIYIIHANGNTWIELGSEGTIDAYAANSINFRSGGEINFHADTNINFNAVENFNIFSGKATHIEANTNLELMSKQSVDIYSETKVGIKSDGALALDSSSNGSWLAGGTLEFKGATIGLNNGSADTVKAPKNLSKTNFPDTAMDAKLGWKSEDGKLETIVSRVPTHEPFAGHGYGLPTSSIKQPGA